MVKRKRAVDVLAVVRQGAQPDEPQRRPPKVFRAVVPIGLPDATDEARPAEDAPSVHTAPDGSGEVAAPPRRRRRKRHGEVKVIYAAPAATDEPDGGPDSTDAAAVPRPPLGFDLSSLSLSRNPQYQALMAEIAMLEQEATRVRKAEAADTVRWIRKAIADYDLSAADLGF